MLSRETGSVGDDASTSRPSGRASIALCGVLVLVMLAAAPPAGATTVYAPIGSFGSAGSGAGQFVSPQRVAVDPVTGDVFVADSGNDRVQVFRPSATPGSCAEACVTYLTSFGSTGLTDEPIGVAVDPETGDVYVMAAGATQAIVKFRPDARAAPTSYSQVSGAEFTSPPRGTGRGELGSFGQVSVFGLAVGAVAVDPTGAHDLLVADPGNREIERFSPEGAFIGSFDGVETAGGGSSGEPGALLAEPVDLAVGAGGDVYVADLDEAASSGEGALRFLRFDGEGVYKATLAAPRESNPNFSGGVLATDPETGDAFVSSFFFFSPSEVYRFGADDQPIDHFRCPGAVCESPLFGIAAAPAAGPTPARLYVVGADSFFGGAPSVQVFEAVELPSVTIAPPDEVSATAATFRGTVDPKGSDAHWRFEYRAAGSSDWIKAPAPDGDAGSGTGPVEVAASASGLEPNTPYEVRLVALKGAGEVTSQVVTFATSAESATAITGGPFSTTDTSATLSGAVVSHNSPIVDCNFEYGPTIAYGSSVPCSPGREQLDDRDEVQRIVVGAEAISFIIRFAGASTSTLAYGEPAGAVEAALNQLPTVGGVGGSVSVTGGPKGNAPKTPYVVTFEGSLGHRDVEQLAVVSFGNSRNIGQETTGVETIHPGGASAQVAADVQSLQPGATYHFRLVAENGIDGPQSGTDRTFTTRAAAEAVHPQRHYELVSAADTNGIEATPDAAAVDGDAYAYSTFLPTPPEAVSGKQSVYVATRNPDGTWTQHAADLPTPSWSGARDVPTSGEFFSDDLSRVAVTGGTGFDPDDQNGSADTYLKQISDGQVTWVSRDPALSGPQTEPGAAFPSYISPDGRTVIFRSDRNLLPADASDPATRELYRWRDGVLSLLSLVPAEGNSCGGPAGRCLGEIAESGLGSSVDEKAGTSYGAVSRDGSRVVFEAGTANRLFVRLDGERTVAADASAPGAPSLAAGPLDVNYWGADEAVEHVFFTSSSPLTPDSSAPDAPEAGGISHEDLYDFDVGAGTLRDLTPAAGGAGVERVYDVSADGRRIYFTAGAQLTGPDGAPGGPNLYVAEIDGSNVRLRFIATIDPLEDTGAGGLFTAQAFRETAANADGSVLAFRDRLNAVPGRRTGGFPQVFVYDANRDELSCASCPGDGSPADGASQMAFHNFFANGMGSHFASVSKGGSVFFESPTALLGTDSDGVGDVYEWRGGTLALISAGTGGRASTLAGAARDGSTVFFASADHLAPAAQAGIIHIYAARVSPAPESVTARPPCRGEDCRLPAAAPSPGAGAGTAAFSGPGNVASRHRCPRGRRLVHQRGTARCVPRRGHRVARRSRHHHGRRGAR
jgi:hypothetical protein